MTRSRAEWEVVLLRVLDDLAEEVPIDPLTSQTLKHFVDDQLAESGPYCRVYNLALHRAGGNAELARGAMVGILGRHIALLSHRNISSEDRRLLVSFGALEPTDFGWAVEDNREPEVRSD